MERQYIIKLDSLDLGQLLDGLDLRAESWEKTAQYLRRDFTEDCDYMIEECSKPEEADGIAAHYRSILSKIQQQMEAQS